MYDPNSILRGRPVLGSVAPKIGGARWKESEKLPSNSWFSFLWNSPLV